MDDKKEIKKQYEESIKNAYDSFESNMLNMFKSQLGINEEEYKAVIFISMLIYHCEKSVENACSIVIKKGVITPRTSESIDYIFDELTFSSKINVYEKLLKKYPENYRDLLKGLSFYRELNSIRNKIFHCKLNEILYKGRPVAKQETKLLLIKDMIESTGQKVA